MKRSGPYLLLAILLLFYTFRDGTEGWQPVLIAIYAIAMVYTSLRSIFLEAYLRKQYSLSDLAGKRYRAKVDDNGIEAVGAEAEWKMKWSYIEKRSEGTLTFSFTSPTVVFIFGKRFLTLDQQQEMRTFVL